MKPHVLLPLLTLLGCSGEKSPLPEGKVFADRVRSNIEAQESIGRFQLVQGTSAMPALIIDTATGCVEAMSYWDDVSGPSKRTLIRQRVDEVIQGTPKRCKVERDSQ